MSFSVTLPCRNRTACWCFWLSWCRLNAYDFIRFKETVKCSKFSKASLHIGLLSERHGVAKGLDDTEGVESANLAVVEEEPELWAKAYWVHALHPNPKQESEPASSHRPKRSQGKKARNLLPFWDHQHLGQRLLLHSRECVKARRWLHRRTGGLAPFPMLKPKLLHIIILFNVPGTCTKTDVEDP